MREEESALLSRKDLARSEFERQFRHIVKRAAEARNKGRSTEGDKELSIDYAAIFQIECLGTMQLIDGLGNIDLQRQLFIRLSTLIGFASASQSQSEMALAFAEWEKQRQAQQAEISASALKNQAAIAREGKSAKDGPRATRLRSAVLAAIGAGQPVDSGKYAESILDQVRKYLGCDANNSWPSAATVRRAVRKIIKFAPQKVHS